MKNLTSELKNLKAVKEIRKIIGQVKLAQEQLRKLVRDKKAIAQAKGYTHLLRKEVQKHLNDDIARIKVFLDRARDELKAIQKQYLSRPRRQKSKTRTKKSETTTVATEAK